MKYDVFISYSSKDIAVANNVKSILEANGIKCWMAPESIPVSSSYMEEIPDGIENSAVFLLLLSEQAQKSKWVTKEMGNAITAGKIIIPFMISNCEITKAFKFSLGDIQRWEAYEDLSGNLEKLARRIKGIVGIELEESANSVREVSVASATKTQPKKLPESKQNIPAASKKEETKAETGRVDDLLEDFEIVEDYDIFNLYMEEMDKIINELLDEKEEKSPVKVSPKKEVSKEEAPKKVVQEENGVKTWNNLLEYEIKKSSTETYVVITGFSKKNTSVHEIDMPQLIEGYPVREVKMVQRGMTWFSSIIVPDGVKKVSFAKCTNVQSVTLPDSVYKLDSDAFNGCDSLMDIHFPNHPVYFEGSLSSLSAPMKRKLSQSTYPVLGGTLLELNDEIEGDIVIPEGVFYINSLGIYFGKSTKKITSITFPSSLEKIEGYTFSHCDKLERVVFQKGIKSIGSYAFRYCPELKEVRIPKSTAVARDAFSECPKAKITRY